MNYNEQKKNKNAWEVLNNKTAKGRNNILAAGRYFQQFVGIKIDTIDSKGKRLFFDGDLYIKKGIDFFRKIGIVPGNPDADIKLKNIKPMKTRANRSFYHHSRR